MSFFFKKNSANSGNSVSRRDDETRHILILDDDMMGCELMQFNLEHEGFEVDVFTNCEDAIDHDLTIYCLYIINVASETAGGMRLAQYVKQRSATSRVPLIFCSSVECEESIINGLDFGADDYLLKPFSMRELTARVNALLRRRRMYLPSKPKVIVHHGLRLDTETKTASLNGDTIPMESAEYDLLEFLMQNKNSIFDADVIYDNLWPEAEEVDDERINRYVENLRGKVGHNSIYLVNRLGFGYGYVE